MRHRLRQRATSLFLLLLLLAAFQAHADQANCSGNLVRSNLANPVVELRTTLGSVCVEVLADQAPETAANFLAYLRIGDLDGTFFHRALAGFVLQGGGFRMNVAGDLIEQVPALAAVVNEPCTLDQAVPNASPPALQCSVRGNVRGTLAMAKIGNQPDSATNQWFFNAGDNRPNLDNQNEGFSVFARVLGDGMQVVDQVLALPALPFAAYNLDMEPVSQLSTFPALPVTDLPQEPPGGFGCFSLDDLAVTFADVDAAGCAPGSNLPGFSHDACESGRAIASSAEPSGLQVVSGACGTRLPQPAPLTATIGFTPFPSQSGTCSEDDRFAWGVTENASGQLAFLADETIAVPPTKIPYALTCAETAESDARLAERRSTMMTVTQPLLVYLERAVLSPEIVSPSSGGALAAATQTFTWDPHDTQADAWAVWLGSTPGGQDYGVRSVADPGATSFTFEGLPYAGETLHATLWWRVNGRWSAANSRRHTFSAAQLDDPEIISHADQQQLDGHTATFSWRSNGVPAAAWTLWFGSTPGGREFGSVLTETATDTSLTFDGLPYQGQTVYMTLYWQVGGTWLSAPAYTFTAANLESPRLTAPEDPGDGDAVIGEGEAFTGSSATFTWNDNGTPTEDHAIWIGSTPGGLQHGYAWASEVDSGNPAGVTELVFDALPYDGETVHVTFWWKVRGQWFSRPYTFTATSASMPGLTGPDAGADGIGPGEALPGTGATFTWNDNGTPTEDHAIWFGSTPGGLQHGYAWASKVDSGNPAGVTELVFDALPYDGETVHVTFWWKVRGTWFKRAYTYTAVLLPDPQLTGPESGTDGDAVILPALAEPLAGTRVTFTWDDRDVPTQDHAVWVGSTPGGLQYGYAWASKVDSGNPAGVTELVFDALPYDGEVVHVTFWWKANNVWSSRGYIFTAADLGPPTLASNAGIFTWDDQGVPTEDHAIWFGTTPGGAEHGYVWARVEDAADPAGVTELTFDGLPDDGSVVHVTFWWMVRGTWFSSRYTLHADGTLGMACTAPGCEAEVTAACAGLATLEQRQICAHNVVRAGVAPAAVTPIPPLTWDPALAQVAQAYADQCVFEHNPNREADYANAGGSGAVGENLAAGTSLSDLQGLVLWAQESADYGLQPIGSVDINAVGHYTQVVWAGTSAVGCAVADCSGGLEGVSFSGTLLVCNYAPAGNVTGQRPYTPGG